MRNNASTSYSLLLTLGDTAVILLSFIISYVLRVTLDDRPLVEEIPALTFATISLSIAPLWIVVFASLGLYKEAVYGRRIPEIGRLLIGSFIGILLVIGYEFLSNEPIFPARLVPVYALLSSFSLLVLMRSILWQVRKAMFRYGWWVNNVMIIGSNEATKDLATILSDTRTSGYNIVAIIGAQSSAPKQFAGKHFSDLNQGLSSISRLNVHTIVQTRLYKDETKNFHIANAARQKHVAYKFVPSEATFTSGTPRIELFHYFPVISIHQTPLLGWGRIAKRVFDFAVSLVAITILSPLLVLIAILIVITNPGPILFTQKRLSRYGRSVPTYKFRSMKHGMSGRDPRKVFAEIGKPELYEQWVNNRAKVDNDPRITKVGAFLRATSLDELPQLFNVLRGDLSLVGPRAIPEVELDPFEKEKPLLLSVKSGITGLAQVSGRSDISMEERIRLDLFYVQSWSFWLDVRILLKTVWVVFGKLGAR